jgi:hypothetical protein
MTRAAAPLREVARERPPSTDQALLCHALGGGGGDRRRGVVGFLAEAIGSPSCRRAGATRGLPGRAGVRHLLQI